MQARPDVTSFSERRQRLCFAAESIASLQNLHGTRVHRLRKCSLVRDRARRAADEDASGEREQGEDCHGALRALWRHGPTAGAAPPVAPGRTSLARWISSPMRARMDRSWSRSNKRASPSWLR